MIYPTSEIFYWVLNFDKTVFSDAPAYASLKNDFISQYQDLNGMG